MPGGIRGGLSFRTRRMGRLTGPGEAVEVTAAYRPRGRLVGSVGWEAPSLGHEKGSRTKRILAPVPMELASWRPSLETCNLVRASGSEGQAFPGPEACLSPNLDTPCERLLGVTQTLPLVGLGSTSGRGPPRGRCQLEPVRGTTAWFRGVPRLSLRRWVFCPAVRQDSPADRGQPEPREGHAHRRAHGWQHRGDRWAEGTRSPSHPRYRPPACSGPPGPSAPWAAGVYSWVSFCVLWGA